MQNDTPPKKSSLGLVGLAVVALIIWGAVAWILLVGGPKADAGAGAGPQVGALAPDFALKDVISGQTVTLSSLRGKPVWINFWATWCEACRQEMPSMQKVYEESRGKGLVLLGVDAQESVDTVANYVKSNKLSWTFLLDSDGQVLDRYFVSGLPTHWFVGKDGILRAVYAGIVPADNLKQYLDEITELVAGSR